MTRPARHESVEHRECYGRIFPDVLHGREHGPKPGKVFSYRIERAGGIGVTSRQAAVDMTEWDACTRCPELEDCYRLSLGLLTLETAAARE